MLPQHYPIKIARFRGLFDTGREDACPLDHFRESTNLRFTTEGVETREGSSTIINLANIRRFHTYKRIGEVSRFLILDNLGRIFDSLNLVSPILNIPTMTDFSMVNFFNRAYISPHNGFEGLPGEFVYVYDGTGTARLAAGFAPAGTLIAADSASSGNVSAGYHLFAITFETSSGYLTKPGPATYAVLNAVGNHAVDLSGIPIGPVGTVRRHILATESISPLLFVGDQDAYEFFFVPGESIPNNIETTKTINFFDTQLLQSADYLFDQLERIPASIVFTTYSSRLIAGGADGENSVVRISKQNDPESFSAIDGLIVVDPTESGGVKSAVEFRETLYIFKSLRTYATQKDAQLEPALWNVITIDKGVGTEVFGVSTILDAKGTSTDRFLIADRSGLLLYDGYFHRPELTWKIENIWNRINKNMFHLIQVLNDTITKSIYILVPADNSVICNVVLHADYTEGITPETLKWSLWTFPFSPVSGVVDVDSAATSKLKLAGYLGDIREFEPSSFNDSGTSIDCSLETARIFVEGDGEVNHFGAVRSRIAGSGNLQTTISGEDDQTIAVLPTMPLNLNPGQERIQWCNFINEKASFKFRVSNFNERFSFSRITVYAKKLWTMRYVG